MNGSIITLKQPYTGSILVSILVVLRFNITTCKVGTLLKQMIKDKCIYQYRGYRKNYYNIIKWIFLKPLMAWHSPRECMLMRTWSRVHLAALYGESLAEHAAPFCCYHCEWDRKQVSPSVSQQTRLLSIHDASVASVPQTKDSLHQENAGGLIVDSE